jgi:hypothetical protein
MRKAQSTAEYAIVIGLVIAAAVAMQVYVKRGLQGKMKDASDITMTDTTSGAVIGQTNQYEPYYMKTDMDATRSASEKSKTSTGGGVKREIVGEEVSTRTGEQKITESVNQP